MEQEWFNVADFCKYAGLHKSRVHEWIRLKENPLPAYRPAGGHWRINRTEADEWIRTHKNEVKD